MIESKENLVDYFSCEVCAQTFDQYQKFPRILICGHTFCETCISKMINTDKQFKCPICKCNLGRLRLGQTYKNYSLLKLMTLNNINSQHRLQYTIQKSTFPQIVNELDIIQKNLKKLIIKRTFDNHNTFVQLDDYYLMRLFKLIPLFQNLQHLQLWIKFYCQGLQSCLAESLTELKQLKYVKIVTPYDIDSRIYEVISLTVNKTIQFDIKIQSW